MNTVRREAVEAPLAGANPGWTCVAALLGCTLLVACGGKQPASKTSVPEPSPRVDAAALPVDASAPPAGSKSTEIRQTVVEAEKLVTSGSYDEAAARLLK